MNSTAILVGNSEYEHLDALPCCQNDLSAMRDLLSATKKYSEIVPIENRTADELKSEIRAAIDERNSTRELCFYFTGHGCVVDDEFYYCSTGFDSSRPNETGLSNNDLHTLLRLANAELVVKIIDACRSGISLIKSDITVLPPDQKGGFQNLIQISSCLDSQNSLAGEPMSVFTGKFRSAALRKTEGTIYYLDIISNLRDEFGGTAQTPFFVSQVTGKEAFVDDAKLLDSLRDDLSLPAKPDGATSTDTERETPCRDIKSELQELEEVVASPERMSALANELLDKAIAMCSTSEFSDLFDTHTSEDDMLVDKSANTHIIGVLMNEQRCDKLATIHKRGENDVWSEVPSVRGEVSGLALFLGMLSGTSTSSEERERMYRDNYDVRLNCQMERAQLKITLTPRYRSLRQLVVVVSCVPSIEQCYAFGFISEHRLLDFGTFDHDGDEVARYCWRLSWNSHADIAMETIAEKLRATIRSNLDETRKRLPHQRE